MSDHDKELLTIISRLADTMDAISTTVTMSFTALAQSDSAILEVLKDLKDTITSRDARQSEEMSDDVLAAQLEKLPSADKPLETFIHSLELVKDRYASTTSQKKAIDSVISNIKKQK